MLCKSRRTIAPWAEIRPKIGQALLTSAKLGLKRPEPERLTGSAMRMGQNLVNCCQTWQMIGLKRPEPDRLTRSALRMRQWVGVKQDKSRTWSPGFSWTITRPSNQYNMRPNSGHLSMGGLGLKGLVESLPTLVDIRRRLTSRL